VTTIVSRNQPVHRVPEPDASELAAFVSRLSCEAISARLAELSAERQILLILWRAAQRAERLGAKITPAKPSQEREVRS
jgi:hypothetical protein